MFELFTFQKMFPMKKIFTFMHYSIYSFSSIFFIKTIEVIYANILYKAEKDIMKLLHYLFITWLEKSNMLQFRYFYIAFHIFHHLYNNQFAWSTLQKAKKFFLLNMKIEQIYVTGSKYSNIYYLFAAALVMHFSLLL